tara:strand:- start:6997 stop:7638 length:642 start_codon:yes stop_codon:yes gene_type:complete
MPKSQNKQFYETVNKEIKETSAQKNSWVNIPISESLQAQLEMFKLWVIMEKTTASLMRHGQKKDGNWDNDFRCDTIDYGITLFLLEKYINKECACTKYVSLTEIQDFLENEGLTFDQIPLSQRLNNLTSAGLIQTDSIKNIEYASATSPCFDKLKKYHKKIRNLYCYNTSVAEFFIYSWKKGSQEELNLANATNMKKVYDLCKSITKRINIFE